MTNFVVLHDACVLSNSKDINRELLEKIRAKMSMYIRDCLVDNDQYLIGRK